VARNHPCREGSGVGSVDKLGESGGSRERKKKDMASIREFRSVLKSGGHVEGVGQGVGRSKKGG